MTISDILVALRAHYKTGEYQVRMPMHDIVRVIKGMVEAPLLAEIAQLSIDKQNMASQLAYLSHVRLEDWGRNNPVQTNPPPAVPTRAVKFEIYGVQWYSYTSSSDMPGMSYYTAFPVYLLIRDKVTQTLQQLRYPDGLTMHSNLTDDIIGYRFINESDDPFYNTPIKPTTQPTLTPSDKDRIALAKWFAGNDTGISSRAIAAAYLAGTDVFDKGTDNTPRDAPDLGRCIRLVAICPDIVNVAFPILRTMHPVWKEYVDHWKNLTAVYNISDYRKTTDYMDVLRKYASGTENYKEVISEYTRVTATSPTATSHPISKKSSSSQANDPLQHIKDALKADRQVQRMSMALPPQQDSQDHHWYYILSTVCPYPEHAEAVAWYNNPHNYRVLLNHTDIKPTTVFRNKGVTTGFVAVSEVTEVGVYFNNNQLVPWHDLADTAEYSHDGVTWKPCLVLQPK